MMNDLENMRVMRFFNYTHLPEKLQAISKPFFDMAEMINATTPNGKEKEMAFRKLLESKDCAVRASL